MRAGTNGRFATECRNGALTRYQCEIVYGETAGSHLGPNPTYGPSGKVVPDAETPCESYAGTCRDGACFWPPTVTFSCGDHPPPCVVAPERPNDPSLPGAICCPSGSGHAYGCATQGKMFACAVSSELGDCVRLPESDRSCYSPRL